MSGPACQVLPVGCHRLKFRLQRVPLCPVAFLTPLSSAPPFWGNPRFPKGKYGVAFREFSREKPSRLFLLATGTLFSYANPRAVPARACNSLNKSFRRVASMGLRRSLHSRNFSTRDRALVVGPLCEILWNYVLPDGRLIREIRFALGSRDGKQA